MEILEIFAVSLPRGRGDENDQLEEVEPLGEEMDPLGDELDPLSEEAIDALNPLEKLDKYFQSDDMLER